MVRINNITKDEGVKCEIRKFIENFWFRLLSYKTRYLKILFIVAKCEFLNPGGSMKDRIARRMILDAEKVGKIKRGDILVEPTSGNTGIGLSMCAAARGYSMIITMLEKMSAEKENTMRGLGAEIVRTPTELPSVHIDSYVGIAQRLSEDLDNAHMLNQYSNVSNPMAHYEGTAAEIWEQCDGKIDTVVLGVGTGGTVTGIARYLKGKDPNIRIVGVDPEGSILAEPAELNSVKKVFQVEGVGKDYIPRALDRSLIDKWYKSPDKESLEYNRRLIKREGLLVGGSSGSVMWAALEEAKDMQEGQRIVTLFPDSVRNYMTKYLSDDWMYMNGFMDEKQLLDNYTPKLVENRAWGQEKTVGDLKLEKSPTVPHTVTIGQAINEMGSKQQILVANDDGTIHSVFTIDVAMDKIFKGKITTDDNVTKSTAKVYRKTSTDIPLSELARIFTLNTYVVVNEETIVTQNDLLEFFANNA
jgi:cystathionine beta-synthase